MYQKLWPDYENCLANLPNSIMNYFGVTPIGATLPLLDNCLKKRCKNIVVILLDGMGVNIMEENLDKDGFFRTHLAGCLSSVFPPLTKKFNARGSMEGIRTRHSVIVG